MSLLHSSFVRRVSEFSGVDHLCLTAVFVEIVGTGREYQQLIFGRQGELPVPQGRLPDARKHLFPLEIRFQMEGIAFVRHCKNAPP